MPFLHQIVFTSVYLLNSSTEMFIKSYDLIFILEVSPSQVQKAKKLLDLREILNEANEKEFSLSASKVLPESENLTCPYNRCAKTFEQPLVLTDLSKTPRETYYACPYCFSKLEIALTSQENLNSVSIQPSDNANITTPEKCSHHFGYLSTLRKEESIPDECLTCPKLIQCTLEK